MTRMDEIVNKVAQSGLITIDPEEYYPEGEIAELDIKQWLFEELILKEKLFRDHMANHDWSVYNGRHVAVNCSADAIIPTWAYMLVGSKLADHAASVYFGNRDQLIEHLLLEAVRNINVSAFAGQRVVVKGCSVHAIPASVYMALTARLQPVVRSVMYGEACSTVPVFKRKE